MEGLPVLQVIRPTAFPAVLMLALWPLFMLLPARASRGFFILSGVGLVTLLGGPLLALAIVGVVLLGYALAEAVACQRHNRRAKFIVGLIGLHAAYWASFALTPPAAFATLRDADRVPVFILFSGVGVTFFRLVSYYFDRARGTIERVGLVDYLAHMCFFPQLRHGPIERCGEFSEKIADGRQNWRPADAGIGLARVGIGFGLLLGFVSLLAAGRPPLTGEILLGHFANPDSLSLGQMLLLMHLPPVLLYVMESSFAHIQLGVSRVFGVRGTENYNFAFVADSPRTFWRRWNITLSNWLRDYAYKPLGTRRWRHLSLFLTFVYCGLLHGMQWRCVMWGVWTGGTLALGSWIADTIRSRRRRGGAPRRASGGHKSIVLRVLRGIGMRLLTWHWLAIGVMILVDPEHCGWRVLRRYVLLLIGAE